MLPRMLSSTCYTAKRPEIPQDVAAEVGTRRTRQALSGVEEARWNS